MRNIGVHIGCLGWQIRPGDSDHIKELPLFKALNLICYFLTIKTDLQLFWGNFFSHADIINCKSCQHLSLFLITNSLVLLFYEISSV